MQLLQCHCCDAQCGLDYGCNCADCMQLDVSSRHLPPGQLANSEGRVSRRLLNSHFYCGQINHALITSSNSPFERLVQRRCSSQGPLANQCISCIALECPYYAAVRSGGAIALAGSPEDTVTEYAELQPRTRQQISVPANAFPAFSSTSVSGGASRFPPPPSPFLQDISFSGPQNGNCAGTSPSTPNIASATPALGMSTPQAPLPPPPSPYLSPWNVVSTCTPKRQCTRERHEASRVSPLVIRH